ncbi:MAG: alpha/beta hydrolase [Cytophagales bacterium]|nr:alpha/beta hydrolase [Cytophagales bacterium]
MIQTKYRKMAFIIALLALLVSCEEENTDTHTISPYVPNPNASEFTIEHHVISDIQIDIYIPPEYDGNQTLPILYFNDGDNFQYVFNLLTEEYAEPFLMVGLYAGANRSDKYVPYYDPYANSNTRVSVTYSKAIIDGIIPFVESRFKADESRRAIFGMSFGGLHATWMGLKYPEIFSFVGTLSPSFWVDDYTIIRNPVSGLSQSNVFYFDIGTNYYVPFINSLKNDGLNYASRFFIMKYLVVLALSGQTEFIFHFHCF